MYKMDIAKKILFLLLLLVLLKLSDNNIVNSNPYLTSDTHQIVAVTTGDSAWSIAARYVTDKDDIRHLISAIKQLNQLDNNVHIYPGQLLKIPLPAHTINVAQK